MGDFFREATKPHARKQYVCEACGWFIPQGEQHIHQTGVYDGSAFSNRFHNECNEALKKLGETEFITGDVPVPERFKAEMDARMAAVASLAAAPKET